MREYILDDAMDEEPVQDTIQMTKDVLRSHIKTFVNALLQHTISMSFLQSVKHGNGRFSTNRFWS